VQQAIVDVTPALTAQPVKRAKDWLGGLGDELLSAVLVYGYPALGLILLLGALGLPLPTGLATAVAGSLVAQGQLNGMLAGAVVLLASIAGDMAGYVLGRLLSDEFLKRRGYWVGYTPARRERVERLFDRSGALTILLSRTLISHVSSVVNLLAGISRYRKTEFLAFTALGRIIWSSAYLSLGYAVGGDLDAATGFLGNLSGLLLTLAILTGGIVALRQSGTRVCIQP
jgi:membrane protein DedA with SNARE-associated domain